MTAFRPFRFGVIAYDAQSKEEWVAKARRIEQLGYATLLVPDHLGKQLASVPAMLTAAEATRSLRVGSYVFANDFRHPVLLAKGYYHPFFGFGKRPRNPTNPFSRIFFTKQNERVDLFLV